MALPVSFDDGLVLPGLRRDQSPCGAFKASYREELSLQSDGSVFRGLRGAPRRRPSAAPHDRRPGADPLQPRLRRRRGGAGGVEFCGEELFCGVQRGGCDGVD